MPHFVPSSDAWTSSVKLAPDESDQRCRKRKRRSRLLVASISGDTSRCGWL